MPVENLISSEVSSYWTWLTSPLQAVFSLGALPAGTKRIPLALPYSSVTIGVLNEVNELPATPVNLESGNTHLPIFLCSINT